MAKPRTAVRIAQRDERAERLIEHRVITPERACKSKVYYATQNDARHSAKMIAKEKERGVSIYRCPFCPGFHLSIDPHEDAA